MHKLLFSAVLLISSTLLFSQEFICQVQVSSPQVQGTDRRVFQTLQTALYEFVNDTKWTNYDFKVQEKIECTIGINISERISSDEFKGTLNIQLRRPIYKTSYNSVILNYFDKNFQFKYLEYESLEFNENTFTSNLTSVIAYYIYIFLGMDFDSYALNGGSQFFEKAQSVVNSAQSSPMQGWKAFESLKNRYWMVENLLNSSYSSLREANYNYHRKGLDLMSDNIELGRSGVYESLELLRKVNREKPGLFMTQVFLEAKSDELVNIFSQASPTDKQKAVNILKEIDPSNSGKYQKILQTSTMPGSSSNTGSLRK